MKVLLTHLLNLEDHILLFWKFETANAFLVSFAVRRSDSMITVTFEIFVVLCSISSEIINKPKTLNNAKGNLPLGPRRKTRSMKESFVLVVQPLSQGTHTAHTPPFAD